MAVVGVGKSQMRRALERAGATFLEESADSDGGLVMAFKVGGLTFLAILSGPDNMGRYAACHLAAMFAGDYSDRFAANLNRRLSFARATTREDGPGLMISYGFPLNKLGDESLTTFVAVFLMELGRISG